MLLVYDHVDVRVRDLDRAKPFYDRLCAELDLTRIDESDEWRVYLPESSNAPMLSIVVDAQHCPNETRVAFGAASHAEVDRIAYAARDAGAKAFEGPGVCPEYTPVYYAAFFEDPDGNKYEICHRGDTLPHVARIWRGRVRNGALNEYRDYVVSTGLHDYRTTHGNRGAYTLSAQRPTHGEIMTLSFWSSYDAIKGFAGEPIDRARYYPEDEKYLLDFPPTVEHFDM
jgi:catechol 2,3-dioxygenase-like lactoylglutathione lyase family enzyme